MADNALAASNEETRVHKLEERVKQLEQENLRLRLDLINQTSSNTNSQAASTSHQNNSTEYDRDQYQQLLSKEDIERYSRQLLLQNGFGVTGQAKILNAKILVVGAGGIGSTALLYLAGFGVGALGVVDYDVVETSNLHRQVIHKQRNVGMNKALSARHAILELNPNIDCRAILKRLAFDNALEVIQGYDIVVDASDNPQTRYLINDACVLAGKPLVSGSAVQAEGQLTVYNHHGGPCYRCLYPKPAISLSCGKSCSDAGVLGPVPGLIGVLQAMETIKLITSTGETMGQRMLHYNALQTSFVNFKKPLKRKDCPVCGSEPTIRSMVDSRSNLEDAQGKAEVCSSSDLATLSTEHAISCNDYKLIHDSEESHILLDVRVEQQYELCSLKGSINIPLARIPQELGRIQELSAKDKPIYCICRRGIASTEATRLLLAAKETHSGIQSVHNIAGGLQAWHKTVDSNFPNY